jgi:catechol 2,3-dioxygenase-like lactoylglutathione lyase family enzyme
MEEAAMPGVIPSVRVADLPEAIRFYTEVLGFALRRGGPDEDNVSVERGDASLMLERPASFYSAGYNQAIRDRLGTPSAMALYIEANDLDDLHGRAQAGAKVVDPLADREWGQREFTVEDPAGNWLTFWQALPEGE